MPLLVGFISDFYLSVTVDSSLTTATLIGYASREQLCGAELRDGGLLAVLPFDDLALFTSLPREAVRDRPSHSALINLFDEWRTKAGLIIERVGEIVESETDFSSEEIETLSLRLRDDILQLYGERLPDTGLEPLFERLFRRFGIQRPVPTSPGSHVLFENRYDDRTRLLDAAERARYFTEELAVCEKVALYRSLIDDDSALEEHRRTARVFDKATSAAASADETGWHEPDLADPGQGGILAIDRAARIDVQAAEGPTAYAGEKQTESAHYPDQGDVIEHERSLPNFEPRTAEAEITPDTLIRLAAVIGELMKAASGFDLRFSIRIDLGGEPPPPRDVIENVDKLLKEVSENIQLK
jgi:hypothetical protein